MALSATVRSFDSLADSWNRLLKTSPWGSIFSSWDWQAIWHQTLGAQSQLHLLAVEDAGQLVGLAPLQQQGDTVSFVGSVDVCDYLDFLARPGCEPAVLGATLEYLEELPWRQVKLFSLREGSPTLAHLPELVAQRGWRGERTVQDVCPQLPLPADWEGYLQSLRKKDRHELRRKLRRLEAAGNVRYFLSSDISTDVDSFLELHRHGNDDKAGFMDSRMEAFFRRILERFGALGQVELYFMELDGHRVATVVCFPANGEVLLYNSGFHHDYRHLSVGLLLKAYCLRQAIEQQRTRFNFLRGNEPYKYHLGGVDEPVYDFTIWREQG